jgi:metal-responsive CopG/Arc/MetJ family transcriptional regulator
MNNVNDMAAIRINITLPEETFNKLKNICKESDRNRSNIIKRLIENYGDKVK